MSFDFTIQKIDANSAKEAADMVVAVFHEGEPLAHLNTADPKEFAGYILDLCHSCVKAGLGFIAKEVASNKIIGVILTSDLSDSFNPESSKSEASKSEFSQIP